jgi:HK97 family phage major capsid protein/HK97 family phage prohead protease
MPRSLAPAETPHGSPRVFTPGQIVHRQAEQSQTDVYEFVMASDAVDRMGDVIVIEGMDLAQFSANPIALWGHDFSQPIGTWANVRRQAGKLIGRLQLAAQGTSQKVDELRSFLEQRILKTVSVGFRVLEAEEIKGSWGLRFTKSELLECSLVPVPANAAAVRIKSLLPNAPDYLFSDGQSPSDRAPRIRAEASQPRRQLAPGQSGTPAMATISEKIAANMTRSATIDDELNAILAAADNDNGRELTEDETATVETLSAEKINVVRNIEIFQNAEAALGARAKAQGAPRQLPIAANVAKVEPAGFMLAKIATAQALAFTQRVPVSQVIAQRYAHDDRVAACVEFVQRAAVQAADTTTPGWAAELVRQDVGGFIDFMATQSVFAALRARASSLDVSLDGVGKVTIPSRSNRGNLGGAWVGEAGVIPVLQGNLGAVSLEPTKLAGITVFTAELMNATNDQIETILRQAMLADTAYMLDTALLDNVVKVAGVRPAGLRVNSTIAASGGANAVAADLAAAIGAIIAAGGGDDIVVIMNPAQASGLAWAKNAFGQFEYPEVASGTINGKPIIISKNVPAGTVFVVDAAYFVNAAGVPEIKVSEEATLTMANAAASAPTQAIDAAGAIGTANQVLPDGGIKVLGGVAGAGTAGAVAMSVFQQNLIALRLLLPVHWVMRAPQMVSVITGVAWAGLSGGAPLLADPTSEANDNRPARSKDDKKAD